MPREASPPLVARSRPGSRRGRQGPRALHRRGCACRISRLCCSSMARIRCAPIATRWSTSSATAYGFSELLVRMTPLLLTAVAVALPSRLGLINVGGEGQLYMGGWLATAGALAFPRSAGLAAVAADDRAGFRRRRAVGAVARRDARRQGWSTRRSRRCCSITSRR